MTLLTIPRPLRDKLGEEATDAFIEVLKNVDFEGKRDLATKSDIQDVKAEIQLIRSELKSDIQDVKAEIQLVRSELKSDIQDVKAEIQLVKSVLDGKIDKLRTELYGKIDNLKTELSGQSKLYFFILLFAIILSNPKALELIPKFLGIAK